MHSLADIEDMPEKDLILWAVRGDIHAARFCEHIFHISQIWDDLIDQDRDVHPQDINRIMWIALLEVPANPFFQKYANDLIPVMRQYIIDWLDANELEKGNSHDISVAYVLRDSASQLLTQCAYLVGGTAWVNQISLAIRRRIHDEPITSYADKLRG